MLPFDRVHMTSYSPFIETIHLSCSILNIVSYSLKSSYSMCSATSNTGTIEGSGFFVQLCSS